MRCLLFLLLVALAAARVFERCEWAKTLKTNGMAGYRGHSLADWVCLGQWESNFNTERIHCNINGSRDYGIFQINSYWWCDDGSGTTLNGCGILCSELLGNDVTEAINCAKRISREPSGLGAWDAWINHCQGQDLANYLEGCGV